ncbi:saccharopine dehydrogenase NADP-binding domain-containing protein [Rhodocytophaga aerolata]|uniref:Saccharopine dehydrogenase NADP-binding domain-containing protein n=1 Tax=Rhodocytophaga aerolata TaxID=455078 RepID=A0ABT8RGC4_9BACT|nr:saccharopine dehydrogenase NADP-binding domain-containing protein [Rhodocytophaga aerolata]MDO1451157.1 saccharopine dehydrogenase NADP-binding domain-containing protein [Rhodocytophaga aerolata]
MPVSKIPFLIYGAYGYTGELLTRLAVEKGHRPLLGGRDEAKLKPLAQELKLPYMAFTLTQEEEVNKALQQVNVVIHCAGPFSKTAKLMVYACLRNKVHYLDITGEIDVFEWIAAQDSLAKKAEIVLLPGAGFDVVPTDCLAAYLKTRLPDAQHLEMAFYGVQNMSRGTALTMLENMHQGGMIRENGLLKKVPAAYKTRKIDFGPTQKEAVTIPWGDVSTAYFSTGIPNIHVFTAVSTGALAFIKLSRYTGKLLTTPFLQNTLKKLVESQIKGPSPRQRQQGRSYIWGEVRNTRGESKISRLQTPEGYSLTAQTALLAAELLEDGKVAPGFLTPSLAFGPDFILQIPGTLREDVQ